MCAMVCPNEAIGPTPIPWKTGHCSSTTRREKPAKRGGRRNSSGPTLLDRIIFDRISMLTDPALDAGRHEFSVTTTIWQDPLPGGIPETESERRLDSSDQGSLPVHHRLDVIRGTLAKHVARPASGCCLLQ